MTCCPDIEYAVSYLARFTAEPTNLVCKAVKRVMQYLVNTHDTQLHLGEVPSLTAVNKDLIMAIWKTAVAKDKPSPICDCEVYTNNISSIWMRTAPS